MMVEKHHGGRAMEKKTIGQFIAVLRKANGLTQQDLADRLNVSNKAVSRWERDESAPDITLIPALAEILGVTCDELLKGERITYSGQVEKKDVKVEKQVKSLIFRETSKYRTRMWMAFVLVVTGFIMPFAIGSSGYFSDELCWSGMFLMELIGFVVVTLSVMQMRDMKSDSEIFESVDTALMKKYDKCLGVGSYRVYFCLVTIVLFFLGFMIHIISGFRELINFCVMLVALYWLCKERYVAWITGNKIEDTKTPMQRDRIRKMNIIQIGAVILAVVVNLSAKMLESKPNDTLLWGITCVITIGLVLVNIITPIVYAIKNKENKKEFLFWGLRNSLFILSGHFAIEVYSTSWSDMTGNGPFKYSDWYPWELHPVIVWTVYVVTAFYLIERMKKKKVM